MKHSALSLLIMLMSVLTLSAAEPVRVRIDLEPHNDWTVNPLLFGSFGEEHWGDITPGIYEQYIVNPSFETWYRKSADDREPVEKSNVIWQDIPQVEGLAFPWEKRDLAGTPVAELVRDALNTDLAQRIKVAVNDTVLLHQRIPLPFYRVQSYNVSFYVRISGNPQLKVFISSRNPLRHLVKKELTALSGEWQRFDMTFHVPRQYETMMKRYGVFNLGFEVTGEGSVDLDLVTIFPTDCVDGVFNPETIEHFRNYGPTMMRWPGGNFTSGYHWYDGIGRLEDRRSVPNLAWGGLCTNHVGIDEFMRFCELTDITPVMGVGFNQELITPKEVADWVEYCNGDMTTPMGKLRAENGHPEPYNVRYWGIGNEVYGDYQLGHTPDPKVYAEGLVEIIKEVRKVDHSVDIIASAYGAHNTFSKPSDWNEQLIRHAGDYIDGLDIHSYVYGPKASELGDVRRPDVIRSFAASDHCIGSYIDDLRSLLKRENKEHIKLAFLEWGILPRLGYKCTRVPHRQDFVNLLCTSAYLNEFIRNGDFVQMGALHNFSFYVSPVRAHAERVNPRTLLFKHYGMMGGGKLLDMSYETMPVYDVQTDWLNIGSPKNVPEVDILPVRKGRKMYITLMNRNHNVTYDVNLGFISGKLKQVKGSTYTSAKPFDPLLWQNVNEVGGHIKKDAEVVVKSDLDVSVTVPKLSYTLLIVDLQ